jgi:hypothetical protein
MELWFQVCNNIYILYIQVSYSFSVVSDLYLIWYSETFQSYSFQLLSQIMIFRVGSKALVAVVPPCEVVISMHMNSVG